MDHIAQFTNLTSSVMSTSTPSTSQSTGTSPRRRARLQRSERLHSENSYSSWEALIRDSFGQIAWPIRITSWELVDDSAADCVPTR